MAEIGNVQKPAVSPGPEIGEFKTPTRSLGPEIGPASGLGREPGHHARLCAALSLSKFTSLLQLTAQSPLQAGRFNWAGPGARSDFGRVHPAKRGLGQDCQSSLGLDINGQWGQRTMGATRVV